jgi:16S rRNA (guanine966-N2)-methyltransferase
VAQNLIRQNLGRAHREGDARILKVDARRLPKAELEASLVFLDPPYGKGFGEPALESARAQGWIAPGAVVVWEERSPQTPLAGFALIEHRRYGDSHLTFLEADRH